jgi:hypothetical protein
LVACSLVHFDINLFDYIVLCHDEKCINFLLKKVDLNHKTHFGKTVLHLVSAAGNIDIIKRLGFNYVSYKDLLSVAIEKSSK